jgi:hypothetical protein
LLVYPNKMNRTIIILLLAATGLLSCGPGGSSATDNSNIKTPDSAKRVQSQQALTSPEEKYIYSSYEYTGSNGTRLVIQNSAPKSNITYIDPQGKKYVYAVFWTRITNETASPFELAIDFPADPFEIPASSGNYMRLLLPADSMTPDKAPLTDYGLAVKPFLDTGMHTAVSLKRTILPHASSTFYVVTLSNRGVDGTLRTGLRLEGQQLRYSVNDKEIPCGTTAVKDLMPSK